MDKRKLKALMLTDFYQLRLMYILVLVMIVCKAVYNFTSSAATGGCSYMMDSTTAAMVIVFVNTLFSSEDMNGRVAFKRSLPYSVNELVLSKYLVPMSIAALNMITTLLFSLTGALLCKSGISADMPRELSFTLTVSALGVSFMPIVFYPLIFRYGYRQVSKYFGVLGAFIIVISTLVGTLFGIMGMEDESGLPVFGVPVPVCIAVIAAVIVGYIISYRIAVKSCELCDAC